MFFCVAGFVSLYIAIIRWMGNQSAWWCALLAIVFIFAAMFQFGIEAEEEAKATHKRKIRTR
ncbi:MAG: hypothetical protein KBS34_04020 [Phascolarctobacterium sp.]|nr:hypothetical protein [Candidatus Phascolarctobacterium equi]